MLRMSALALALLLPWAPPATATEEPAMPPYAVRVSGGSLTVDLEQVPLAQVLRVIGEQAGIEVSTFGDLGAPVTQNFAGVPLEDGIRRLTRGLSLAVTYAASADDPGSRGLAGIWVMGTGSAASEPSPPLPRGPSGPERASPGSLGEIPSLVAEADRGGESILARLRELSVSGGDPAVREEALAALARLQGVAVEPVLVAALADADPAVRVRAVRGLREIGSETALQSLTGALSGDADPRVRLTAVRALTSFPNRATLDELARAASDPDNQVREAAARGLSWWTTRIGGRR